MTPKQKHLICATSGVDERTLRKFLRGDTVRGASADRIQEAAKKHRIELPAVEGGGDE